MDVQITPYHITTLHYLHTNLFMKALQIHDQFASVIEDWRTEIILQKSLFAHFFLDLNICINNAINTTVTVDPK